jgi:putative ATP-binding cassette transporter
LRWLYLPNLVTASRGNSEQESALAPYSPKIDWGNELVPSSLWIAKTFGISVVCVLIVCVLLVRFTLWGKQFWRISGDYFKGRPSVPVWGLLAVLLLSVIASVRLDVLLSYYTNDLYSALQVAFQGTGAGNERIKDSGVRGFWFALAIFAILATMRVVRTMLDIYLTQRFIIRWRVWLTDRLTADWLGHRAYYRGQFIEHTIDNPDQRIQQDIDVYTTGYGPTANNPSYGTGSVLLFGAVNSAVSVISFAAILWNLSGSLTLFGVTVPKALFWIVIVYVGAATIIAFRIGKPLIGLSFRNEMFNAAFRYTLVRLRDAAEAISFCRGEDAESVELNRRFGDLIANYRRFVTRTIVFTGWNLTVSQAITPLPLVVQAPLLFANEISLGDVSQTSSAFGSVHDGLSFFRNAYDAFASYRASILRLHGLVIANETARELPVLERERYVDDTVSLDRVEVRTPDGHILVSPLDLHLDPGDTLLVTGAPGSGKTTLLRSLALLWPYTSGKLRCPEDIDTMFLSQLSYLPLGNLRSVISYPCPRCDIPDHELTQALVKVSLDHLVNRLDDEQDWAKILSPGEQQCIAFARVLLRKPKAVFMDEATSALDIGLEFAMHRLLRTNLPSTIVVSISHRPTVEQHRGKHLQLLGGGEWRLFQIDGDTPA